MKRMNFLVRKCKSLSRQLGRSSSYSSLRSKSTKEDGLWGGDHMHEEDDIHHHHQAVHNRVPRHGDHEIIYVGSKRKPYVISSKYLTHPLMNALIDKSSRKEEDDHDHVVDDDDDDILIRCEVVLFDHLLWMLQNLDPNLSSESLEELVQLYVS